MIFSFLNKAINEVITTYLWSNDLNILSTSIDDELDSRGVKLSNFNNTILINI